MVAYSVLYFDPPWKFRDENTGGTFSSGASQKYPVMDLPAICQLPVPAIAAPQALLFLWVPTTLKFSHGQAVYTAWGFRYVTTIYWTKTRLGMGHWFRNIVEEILVCERGGYPALRCQRTNHLTLPALEHSEKPAEFRKLIEEATGITSSRYNLEGFARKRVPGWTGIGNAVTGRDIRDDIRLIAQGVDAHGGTHKADADRLLGSGEGQRSGGR
jgi:N6-adenosine-specific RNA methylase IME4